MFSDYVVRAVVADHVERLRGEAVLDELVRCARSANSVRGLLTRAVSARAVSARARHGRLLQHLAHPLTRSAGQPQPCGC